MPPINLIEYEFIDECKDDIFHDLCHEPLVFLRECLEQTHEFLFGNRNFNIKKLTFIVKQMEGVAHTQGADGVKEIHLSVKYIRNFATNQPIADTIYEFHGVMYHEMVHVVQNNSKGTMPWYFIEGIADFTRLRLNLAAKHWKKQVGRNYDAGYDTTGYFLDYCDTLYPGFVSNLNDWAGEHEWDDGIFEGLCGHTIAALWKDYQASLSTGLPIICSTEYYFVDEVKDDLFYNICPEPLVFLQTCLEKTHEALFGNRTFTTKKLTFIVKSMGGVAHTQGSNGVKEIHLSIEYLSKFAKNKIKTDIEYEFHGYLLIIRVMYHEMVHVVQNNANGTMPWYFIEGIADFIRFRLNLGARHWKKQVGRNYDAGYETTGYFLDYCDNKARGFVMRLNEWAGSHDWNDEIFEQMTGKSIKDLWSEYQESIKH